MFHVLHRQEKKKIAAITAKIEEKVIGKFPLKSVSSKQVASLVSVGSQGSPRVVLNVISRGTFVNIELTNYLCFRDVQRK